MATAAVTQKTTTPPPTGEPTLEQILDRQRELVLMREYMPLGAIDFIFIQRGKDVLKIDYRKSGPHLAFNPETGDFVLTTQWSGLPDLVSPGEKCEACLTNCIDCAGTGLKSCTLAGCAGTGYVKSKYVPCPGCLASEKKRTNPECTQCLGRGEVPEPTKCPGCDEQGKTKCLPCAGTGKIATGREGGARDGYDADKNQFVTVPLCRKCNGHGKQVKSESQDWRQFVHGTLEVQGQKMAALGPIRRIVWHTPGEGSRFGELQVQPDRGGNLMVLLLEGENDGARQFLVGGVPHIVR